MGALRHYYDFAVAYEDLLSAPNVRPAHAPIMIDESLKSAVWTFARQAGDQTIVHLINIARPDVDEWRDPQANYPQPPSLRNVRISVGKNWHSAFVASPDDGLGTPEPVPIKDGFIVVPRLDYWSMIVLR